MKQTIFHAYIIVILCGRWGEAEKENASVNRFPAEPTEQQLCCCETLGPGFQGPSALKKVQPFS